MIRREKEKHRVEETNEQTDNDQDVLKKQCTSGQDINEGTSGPITVQPEYYMREEREKKRQEDAGGDSTGWMMRSVRCGESRPRRQPTLPSQFDIRSNTPVWKSP
jgi:hypothetical protein